MFKRLLGVALAAAVLGGAGAAVQTTAQAPPASAGIGYWSNGCNPHAEWFEYAGEHNWRLFTRNEYNKANTQFVIIHALRRTYQGAGNECGGLAELTGNEYRDVAVGPGCAPGTPVCLRPGYRQNMVHGNIFWDDNCNYGFVWLDGIGKVRQNLCQYA